MTTQALGQALVSKMNKGIAHFVYEKTDGTLREAFGTTNLHFVPKEDIPGDVSQIGVNSGMYYDLEKRAWRKYKVDNLKTIFGL